MTGKAIVGALRASGRGSATWRVSQDLKTLPLLRREIFWGTGRWDWFRPAGTRPWGLPLLILGAYGLVGLALLGAAFGGALVRLAAIARSGGPNAAGARLAILLLLLSAIDALFNSFLFYPAIAGAALSGGTPKDAAPDRTPAA